MQETDFLKHLDRLRLVIQKKVASNYIGERESPFLGQGTMFRDHRIYAAGDDIKRIDWKVYARTDKMHVKQYEEDKSLTAHIIIDYSASMNFGQQMKKYEYAVMLGVGIAYVAWKNNDSFVLSTFADKLERFKPKQGRRQIVEILDYLKNKKPQGQSAFRNSLAQYAKSIDRKSMIVVISDFLYDLDEITEVVLRFKDNEVVLVQVLDSMETELKLRGEFNLKDAETNQLMKTFISDKTREKYLEKLADHKKRIDWLAKSTGSRFYSFATDEPIFDSLYRILRAA